MDIVLRSALGKIKKTASVAKATRAGISIASWTFIWNVMKYLEMEEEALQVQ